jgi:hypothetical protein
MARVKRGVTTHAKHKRVLEQAKGYYGRRKNTIRIAKQAVEKAGQYAYRDRKVARLPSGAQPSCWACLAILRGASYPICGASAVTSISERSISSPMRLRFGSMPAAQCSVEGAHAVGQQAIALCRKLWAIIGLNTFSSNCPGDRRR